MFCKGSQVHLKFTSPLAPVCLLVGPERWIFYLEQRAVLGNIKRDGLVLRLALAVAEDIQGDRIEPLPKFQCTYFDCPVALQFIIRNPQILPTNLPTIFFTSDQPQSKAI